MGTWGDGLYDTDGALDRIRDLLRPQSAETDAARLAARIGLLAWLCSLGMRRFVDALAANVAALAPAIAGLPEATRTAIDRVLTDPDYVEDGVPNAPEVYAVLNSYCSGPRLDALLRIPGAQPAIDELAARLGERLDHTLQRSGDLYEIADDLAALGLLVELTHAGLHRPDPARVARWRAGFAAIDGRTTSERRFWSKYVRRVHLGFDLLAPAQV